MKIDKNKTKRLVLYSIIVLNIYIYLIANKDFGNVTIFKYGIMVLGIFYVIFLDKIYKKDMKYICNFILILSILQFFVTPLFVFLIQGYKQSITYSLVTIVYILFCNLLAYSLVKNNIFNNYIRIFYFMTLIYILVSFLQNPVSINFSTIKMNLFDIDNRVSREMFGFVAPNAFAILCISNILSGIYLTNVIYSYNNIKRCLIIISNIFNTILILTTGSRGALLSLISFYVVFYYNKMIYGKIPKIFKCIIEFGIAFIVIRYIIDFFGLNLDYAKLSSGRVEHWENVINVLKQNNTILIGLGYVSPNEFYNNGITSRLLTDNWFIHTLATQGILGLILGISLITSILIYIYKYRPVRYNNEYNFFVSFTVSILIYSIIENMFFSMNYILSIFYWISIIYYLIKCKVIKHKKIEAK